MGARKDSNRRSPLTTRASAYRPMPCNGRSEAEAEPTTTTTVQMPTTIVARAVLVVELLSQMVEDSAREAAETGLGKYVRAVSSFGYARWEMRDALRALRRPVSEEDSEVQP